MTKRKILVDLKPALDGFAGIPQESRLLFSNLLNMPEYADVHGLLQHGTGNYPPINLIAPEGQASYQQTIPISDFLSVLKNGVVKFYIPRAPLGIQRRIMNQHLRLMALTQKLIKLGRFQTDQFDDLIWHALFSKAVKRSELEKVCRAQFRTIQLARQHMQNIALSGVRMFPAKEYLRVDTSEYDVFISQLPFPGRVSSNTTLIVRYHDSVPILMPHTIGDQAIHKAMHFNAMKSNLENGAWFSCVSEATRSDLIRLFPEAEDRSFVIHNTVQDDYVPSNTEPSAVWDVISNYLSSEHDEYRGISNLEIEKAKADGDKIVLMVSTLEPRKNHEALIAAFYEYKLRSRSNVRLVLVGARGWHCDQIVRKVESGIARGLIFHLANVPSHILRSLYTHAAATVCPSFSEGFDYSGVEAMRCGGVVLGSDIPVHREVFGEGALYFDPYSPEALTECLANAFDPESAGAREAQKQKALEFSERYTDVSLRVQWHDKIEEILSLKD